MEAGEFGTVRDLAIAVGLAERHVSRQLRLAYPEPSVLKRLVYGREGPAVTVLDLSNCAARPAKRISDWCNQGEIVGQRDRLGKGTKRELSWLNTMEVAIAAELLEVSVRSPTDAFRAAQRFSHVSDGGTHWVGEDALTDEEPHRWPGLPFDHNAGETFLCVAGDPSAIVLSEDGTVNLRTVAHDLGGARGLVVVNVSEVFMRVAHHLALDGRVVLDAVYSGGEGD